MRLLRKWNILTARVVAFYQQGWYAIAEKIAKETLEFAESAFGPDHPNVAESQQFGINLLLPGQRG